MESKLTLILRHSKHHHQGSSDRARTDSRVIDLWPSPSHWMCGRIQWSFPWLPKWTIEIYLALVKPSPCSLNYRVITISVQNSLWIRLKLGFTWDHILVPACLTSLKDVPRMHFLTKSYVLGSLTKVLPLENPIFNTMWIILMACVRLSVVDMVNRCNWSIS